MQVFNMLFPYLILHLLFIQHFEVPSNLFTCLSILELLLNRNSFSSRQAKELLELQELFHMANCDLYK